MKGKFADSPDSCSGRKALVLGQSKSGIAAAKLLAAQGWDVYLSEYADVEPVQLDGVRVETGGHSDAFLEGAELVVTSPGIPPHSEILQKVNAAGIELISEIELAYRYGGEWIAITGTNGKTTTTALVAHILGETPCGNYGLPPSELQTDRYVCEVSSFQLEFSPTFAPKIAVWTNFAPDHLDWHGGLENYFNAKAGMFKRAQYAMLNAADKSLADFKPAGKVFWFGVQDYKDAIYFGKEKIIDIKDCPIFGRHNYENIEAAIICAKIEGVPNEKIREKIMSFTPPEHRMEKCGKQGKISFYNDSKATNPEAAIVAIKAFQDKDVVLIAGGRDKNTDLSGFCEAVKGHISNVVLIGEAAARFEQNLAASGFSNIKTAPTLQAAIDAAVSLNPDAVLLSPACASFDMFKSYEERGKVFKDYVG